MTVFGERCNDRFSTRLIQTVGYPPGTALSAQKYQVPRKQRSRSGLRRRQRSAVIGVLVGLWTYRA